jgi:septum formation protein
MRLILASGSAARRAMLAAAGVKFSVMPADVDEAAMKSSATVAPEALALDLAVAKARRIAGLAPDALVIGADQILVCAGARFDKPENMAAAASHLRLLRGTAHQLVTASCVVRDAQTLWSHVETPVLTMRDFSETFLENYLAAEGEAVRACVGAYRLEGPGMQLFERIEGDYFTILGLPLLALLGFLRETGAVPV